MIIFGTSSALKPFLVELSDGEFGREFSHPPENQPVSGTRAIESKIPITQPVDSGVTAFPRTSGAIAPNREIGALWQSFSIDQWPTSARARPARFESSPSSGQSDMPSCESLPRLSGSPTFFEVIEVY